VIADELTENETEPDALVEAPGASAIVTVVDSLSVIRCETAVSVDEGFPLLGVIEREEIEVDVSTYVIPL
jgi:hypothetical protein